MGQLELVLFLVLEDYTLELEVSGNKQSNHFLRHLGATAQNIHEYNCTLCFVFRSQMYLISHVHAPKHQLYILFMQSLLPMMVLLGSKIGHYTYIHTTCPDQVTQK